MAETQEQALAPEVAQRAVWHPRYPEPDADLPPLVCFFRRQNLVGKVMTLGLAVGLSLLIGAWLFLPEAFFPLHVALLLRTFLEPFAKQRAPRDLLAELAPEPAPTDSAFAVLHLRHDGVEYATDLGHLAIIDGWLVFEGLKTAFALSPRDLLPRAFGLELHDGIEILFSAYDERKPLPCLSAWAKAASPFEVSVLPPRLPSPDRQDLLRLRRKLSIIGIGAVGLVTWLAVEELPGELSAILFCLAATLLALVALNEQGRRSQRRLFERLLAEESLR